MNPQPRSTIKRALHALELMEQKLQAWEQYAHEPIAIVGMGCRLPGNIHTPEDFWKLLQSGTDAITEVPSERWNVADFYDPDPSKPGKMYARHGGFLERVDEFDAAFFGISPKEALFLDPQQRLLLEVTWEALENANISATDLAQSQTGVFVGIGQNDYGYLAVQPGFIQSLNAYYGTGNGHCFAPGRLSYFLGVQGPCLAIDTACSSSLVAIHMACQSLRLRESDVALTGGVQLMLAPVMSVYLSRTQALSASGRCRTFSDDADGFVRSEGAGMLVLKRLSDALRDGDTIAAVIRGSAINHDGPSSSLTVPNGLAQQKLIRAALKNAQVSPADIQYIEAHGTGTKLGDPIELEALKAVFGTAMTQKRPLYAGSVKTNIGHLEAASGVAGVLKVVLALQHQQLPPHLHLNQPNSHVDWTQMPVQIPTQATSWPFPGQSLLAGVSAFGLSGTNAHVILEQAPVAAPKSAVPLPVSVVTLSARTNESLHARLRQLITWLETEPEASLEQLAYTTNVGRTHFAHRQAWVATDKATLLIRLQQALDADSNPTQRDIRTAGLPRKAFLCTGQGSQYTGMGYDLYQTYPVYRACIDHCAEILRPWLPEPLTDLLFNAPASVIDQTRYTQPLLFVTEYAMARLWQYWGIQPDVVLGHSVGEYVAACLAGIFSLEDGLRLIAERGRLMQALPTGGEMWSVAAEEYLVNDALQGLEEIAIAAVNSVRQVVISGKSEVIHMALKRLEKRQIRAVQLSVSHAFHSPLMAPMLDAFAQVAHSVSYQTPSIPIISNVTGQIETHEMSQAAYWIRHVLAPVRFYESLYQLEPLHIQVCIEVGPQPVLTTLGKQHNALNQLSWLSSLRKNQLASQTLSESLAQLYRLGESIDWKKVHEGYAQAKVHLPTYPFARQSYWLEQTQYMHLPHTLAPKDRSAWMYQTEWELLAGAELPPVTEASYWMIFADSKGVSQALLDSLANLPDAHCLTLETGEFCQQLAENHWIVNPENPTDIQSVWQEISWPPDGQKYTLVYAWPVDMPTADTLTTDQLNHSMHRAWKGLLHVWQQLIHLDLLDKVQLYVLTQEAVTIRLEEKIPGMTQSLLWGMCKVLALEYPQTYKGIIDLDTETAAHLPASFGAALLRPDQETLVAWRSGQRWGARIVPHTTPSNAHTIPVRADAGYLVTGGTGHLGLQTLQWLVSKGAQTVWLTNRSGVPDSKAQAVFGHLQAQGVTIHLLPADVALEKDVQHLFAHIQASGIPLAGIIHAAGSTGLVELADLDSEACEKVLSPKVMGSWLLHHYSLAAPIDFFICFSSIAAAWGSRGQAHYAAANQFMDALMQHRRSVQLPGLSIQWGPWGGGGMTSAKGVEWLEKAGIHALPPAEAIAMLDAVWATHIPVTIVADIDWAVFQGLFSQKGSYKLLNRIKTIPAPTPESVSRTDTTLIAQWRQEPVPRRRAAVMGWLQQQVAVVLGYPPGQQPEVQEGFFEMGMDSLMAVSLKERVQQQLGLTLAATVVFDFPSIEALGNYLLDLLMPKPATVRDTSHRRLPARKNIVPTEVTDWDSISVDELIDILENEIERQESQII